jgi:hypothetical protein
VLIDVAVAEELRFPTSTQNDESDRFDGHACLLINLEEVESLTFWLDLASFARKQLVRKFSRFGKRGDNILTAGKSQWLFCESAFPTSLFSTSLRQQWETDPTW